MAFMTSACFLAVPVSREWNSSMMSIRVWHCRSRWIVWNRSCVAGAVVRCGAWNRSRRDR